MVEEEEGIMSWFDVGCGGCFTSSDESLAAEEMAMLVGGTGGATSAVVTLLGSDGAVLRGELVC